MPTLAEHIHALPFASSSPKLPIGGYTMSHSILNLILTTVLQTLHEHHINNNKSNRYNRLLHKIPSHQLSSLDLPSFQLAHKINMFLLTWYKSISPHLSFRRVALTNCTLRSNLSSMMTLLHRSVAVIIVIHNHPLISVIILTLLLIYAILITMKHVLNYL